MIIPTLTEKLNKPFQKAVESELSFGRNSALKWQYLINEPNRKYPKLISQHDLETNKYSVQSEQELRDLAELNLNKLEVNLTKHQDLVSSDNIEIILSTEQMVKVHELLSSEQIFVSASRKGWFRA
ncbi:MAG: hypothetical protein MRY83_23045, partial [Flavobacteriales bacterium]|nr:hypothetical protein [Flavobacteriales bacterium]